MKLSTTLFLASAPAAFAGTNKTIAPSSGGDRPTSFPTGFTPEPTYIVKTPAPSSGGVRPTSFPTGFTPEPTYIVKTPAPTDCISREFFFDGFKCTNAVVADGEETFNTVQECCNANFGPGSHIDGTCGFIDICFDEPPMSMDYMPPMSMDYILESFGKSGKASGRSGKSGKGSSSKSGKGSSSKSSKGSSGDYDYDAGSSYKSDEGSSGSDDYGYHYNRRLLRTRI